MAELRSGFTPQTPDLANRVQSSFAQQHGFLHAALLEAGT
jgi:hypothetical protein